MCIFPCSGSWCNSVSITKTHPDLIGRTLPPRYAMADPNGGETMDAATAAPAAQVGTTEQARMCELSQPATAADAQPAAAVSSDVSMPPAAAASSDAVMQPSGQTRTCEPGGPCAAAEAAAATDDQDDARDRSRSREHRYTPSGPVNQDTFAPHDAVSQEQTELINKIKGRVFDIIDNGLKGVVSTEYMPDLTECLDAFIRDPNKADDMMSALQQYIVMSPNQSTMTKQLDVIAASAIDAFCYAEVASQTVINVNKVSEYWKATYIKTTAHSSISDGNGTR